GMRGGLSHIAEIIGSANQSLAEVVLPDAIDEHPHQNGVAGVDQSAGKLEPPASLIGPGKRLIGSSNRFQKSTRATSPNLCGLPRRCTRSSSGVPSVIANALRRYSIAPSRRCLFFAISTSCCWIEARETASVGA